jgi:hypothetical protein
MKVEECLDDDPEGVLDIVAGCDRAEKQGIACVVESFATVNATSLYMIVRVLGFSLTNHFDDSAVIS